MKNLNNRIAFLLLMVAGMFGVQKAIADTTIPLTVGNYLVTSTSETTGTINNNDGGNLGGIYKDATATFTLTNSSAQDMVLTFLTGNNNNSSPKVTVTMNDGTQDFFTETVDIENTGGWTPITKHVFDVGEVPAGTVTLKFAFTNTSSYVCNLGSIGVYNKATYIASLDGMPGDITLSKGSYQGGARYNDSGNGKVGWLSNNTYCYYPDLYVTSAGTATLNIGMTYNGAGSINVKIVDLSTGVTEIDKNLSITSDLCHGLTTPTAFELDDITAGFKSMKLTMSTEASYLIDYQDLSLSIESWIPIAIDLRSGQLGTEGNNMSKYVTVGDTYTYSDEEPGSYNALLKANSWNGSQHGYVSFKAKVPVKTGIYKITLGTCQFGSGTGYVKNADESSTLNIVDANGQVQTSFNQNTGACYHNNTTSNVISVWYEATTDQTITIVCGDYTPYFSIESVNSVPETKYTVTYANNTADVEGTVPGVAYATAGNSVTIPVNRTLYKDGYTLTGWSDGNTTYEPGDSYTPTANVTLNAVFTQNTYTFDQTVSEMTVRWDFQRKNGCPTISMQGAGATAILVQQANVNGNTIDMKLDIDATGTGGKFANGSWTDWAQVNDVTTFSFPSVEGTTVKAYSMNEPKNASDVKSSVDGNEYSSYASYIATYATTPTSSSSTLTVKGGTYYRYIDVTYPAAAITGITELTVDGVSVGSEIIAAINNGDAYTATLSGNTYTTVPTVQATFDTSAQATGVVSGTGTSRTYTITQNDKTYTLIVEGIHLYTPTGDDEAANIKNGEGTMENNTWTNGIYTLTTTSLDGGQNGCFKLNGKDYTITIPSDVAVKQFIIKDFANNYANNQNDHLVSVTSEGATAYIPTKNNCWHSTEGASYDLVVNIDGHQAGKPIAFSFSQRTGQPLGWFQLTTVKSDPGTAPVKTAENVTVEKNHAVVAVSFDREISGDVEATINNTTVTAEGGASTLYFPVWDLRYSTNYTLTIDAGAVVDAYDNTNESAIEIAVNIPAKATVSAATYDYVVSTADELKAAISAIDATNTSKSATRKVIFLKNGTYNLGSTGSNTVQWVNAHNISFIGESKDGVIICGTSTDISNPVLNIRYGSGQYLQDLTVRNLTDFDQSERVGVSVAVYGGNKSIFKNVALQAQQDTQVTGESGYYINCDFYGAVDFLCGGGDHYYDQCHFYITNSGYITAPSTSSANKWGYVMQNCTIDKYVGSYTYEADGNFTLGRPWQGEPRNYWLNTRMNVKPSDDGWGGMGTLPTHFYEYNSTDANGDAIDLSVRKNSPTSTNTYTPVLTAEQAAKFTLKNVLGGTDSWLPTDYTTVMDAPEVAASGSTISWDAVDDARCYVIFKDGEYLTNQTETSYDITAAGVYTVRAANEMGGLGETSDEMAFISKTITSAGWATLCSSSALDFSGTDLTAYIVTGTVGSTTELDLDDVTTVPANTGVLLEGNAGDYIIPVIASVAAVEGNKLIGVTESTPIEAEAGYVLMNETAGVGFYKNNKQFTVGANTAYLPADFAGGETTARSAYFFRGEITGVANVEAAEAVQKDGKFFKDGKLVIKKNGMKFSAAGAQVK